jgi:hypothetical protein
MDILKDIVILLKSISSLIGILGLSIVCFYSKEKGYRKDIILMLFFIGVLISCI